MHLVLSNMSHSGGLNLVQMKPIQGPSRGPLEKQFRYNMTWNEQQLSQQH